MDCVAEVVRKSGVDHDTANDILAELERERGRLEAEGRIDDIDRELAAIAKGHGDEARQAGLLYQRQAAGNILRRESWDADLARMMESGQVKSWAEALLSKLEGTHKPVPGGRASVGATRAMLELRYAGRILAAIERERPHLVQLIRRGDTAMLDDVAAEMFGLDSGVRATQNEDAFFLAKTLAGVANEARVRANRAGSSIKYLRNWVPQRHDAAAMLKAGKEAWRRFVLDNGLLDLERTFKGLPPQDIPAALDSIFETIIRGRPMETAVDFEHLSRVGPANLAEALARKHRALHFADFTSWKKYAEQFGAGNVLDTILGHLRELSTDIAAMEHMGPNPQAFMERYARHLEQKIWADPNLSDELKKKATDKLPRDFNEPNNAVAMAYKIATGQADRPANVTWARIGSGARAWTSMSKLGMAAISSITDLATSAARLRWHGVSLFEAYGGMLSGLFSGKTPAQQREIADLLGVGFDAMLGDIHARFMAEDHVSGRLSSAQNLFFKLSGLTAWTERNRSGFALMASRHMAMRAAEPWEAIDPVYRRTLEQHGLAAQDWEVVRRMEKRAADGRDYIVPEAVRQLDDKAFDPVVDRELAKARLLAGQAGDRTATAQGAKVRARFDTSRNPDRAERAIRHILAEYHAGDPAETLTPAQLADALKRPWEELDDRFKDGLERAGIVESNWDILAKAGGDRVGADLASRLRPREQAAFGESLAQAREKDVRLAQRRNALNEEANRRQRIVDRERQALEDKLQRFIIGETDYGILRPDAKVRRWQTAGLKPGTVWGEAARFMMQFKAFPVSFTQGVIGSHVYARDWGGLAHVIAASTALGYLAMSAKDIMKGREPRDPANVNTWVAAMIQGGGAGIYGDFLMQKYSRFGDSPVDTILGPSINTASDLAKLGVNALHGEFEGGEALYTGINNTPFVNLWYTRQALDWLVLYHLQEMASPGYLRRTERRLQETYGQEYIVPPGGYIRRGGGFR